LKKYTQPIFIKILRIFWVIIWFIFCKFTPPLFPFNIWRVLILKIFGAKIDWSSKIYPSAKIFMPWNLIMKKNSCLGKNVDCYNYDKIFIFQNSIISQNSFLCTASHRYDSKNFELIRAPITIKEKVWVAANCFVAPGIMMEKESVLLANSNLTKNTKKNSVYAGNPAKFKKKRY
jgi:putative colanic acid biosynthesis acetyltransferase WcaF